MSVLLEGVLYPLCLCDGGSTENKLGCFPPTLQCWRMRSAEGQSSIMQSGLLRGKHSLNCSGSILCWFPAAAERTWRLKERKSNTIQQLHFLSLNYYRHVDLAGCFLLLMTASPIAESSHRQIKQVLMKTDLTGVWSM